MDENRVGTAVVDSAIKVHRVLGPGLLESVYEVVLAHELEQRGFAVQRQVPITIRYEDRVFEEAFRADMIIDGKVLLELKSVETLLPVNKKQVLSYLKLSQLKLGYLLNFGAAYLKDGIERLVNGLPEPTLSVSASLRED